MYHYRRRGRQFHEGGDATRQAYGLREVLHEEILAQGEGTGVGSGNDTNHRTSTGDGNQVLIQDLVKSKNEENNKENSPTPSGGTSNGKGSKTVTDNWPNLSPSKTAAEPFSER